MCDLARVERSTIDGTPIVRVRDEIDLSNAAQVRDAIGAAVPDTAAVVVVDVSGAAYLDSAGSAMIFRLVERLSFSARSSASSSPGCADPGGDQVIPAQDSRLNDDLRRRWTRGNSRHATRPHSLVRLIGDS